MRVRLALPPRPGLTLIQARQALFNWLAGRHAGGEVVLCVSPDAEGKEGGGAGELSWLGLDWDRALACPGVPAARYQEAAGALPAALRARLLGDDRRPTRALIDAVDDHELRVSHVLHDASRRAEASVRREIYRSLGWDAPRDIYLPPLVDAGPELLAAYRRRGVQPLALANHLARLGWMPRGKQRLLSMAELAARFDLQRLSRSPCPFDPDRLGWFNHRVLRQLDGADVARLAAPRWTAAYEAAHRAEGTGLSPDQWQALLGEAIRDELHDLDEVPDRVRFAFLDSVEAEGEASRTLAQPYALPVLQAFIQELPEIAPWSGEAIDARVSALRWRFKDALGIRSRDVMHVLRAALTGRVDGPCLYVICQLLGRPRCIERSRQVIARLKGPPSS